MVDSPLMIDNDRLVATLNELGVCYIAGDSEAKPYSDLTPDQIIAAMMTCGAVRVEYAVIPLVIRRPEFAAAIPEAIANLPSEFAERLRRHYTAAVYLQRMYLPALELYLGRKPFLADLFSAAMNLPSPDEYYGEIGLREMISRLPPPINWWHSYLDPVWMFLSFLSLEKSYGWQIS